MHRNPCRSYSRANRPPIQSLAGEWEGTYWSRSFDDRKGVLTFALKAGTDSAYGDVTMFPTRGQAIYSADTKAEHALHSQQPQSLFIEFVRVAGGSVEGGSSPTSRRIATAP